MGTHCWHWVFGMAVAIGTLAASCASPSVLPGSPTVIAKTTPLPTVTSEPATAIPTTLVTPELATPTRTTGSEPRLNLDAIAPPGRERDLVLQNCDACHSFVCPFRGQRTAEHWETVKVDMREKVANINNEDYETLFAYLEENFNDKKPEPNLPPELEPLGCSSGVR